jgi:monoamine oxidase
VTKCWDEDEWARGVASYYKPGQFSSPLPHVARPEGRIHVAAEHTSVWIGGWMPGARIGLSGSSRGECRGVTDREMETL